MKKLLYVVSLLLVSALNASDAAILERLRGEPHGACMSGVLSSAADDSLTYASVDYVAGHDTCDKNAIFVLDQTSVSKFVVEGAEECAAINQIAVCGDDIFAVQYNYFGNRFLVFRSSNKLSNMSKIVDRDLRTTPRQRWTCEDLQSMM